MADEKFRARSEWMQQVAAQLAEPTSTSSLFGVTIDRLGATNHERGYEAGDYILTQLSEIIPEYFAEEFPNSEISMTHWGGVRFAVFLSDRGDRSSQEIVDTLRREILARELRWDHEPILVTVSSGYFDLANTTTDDINKVLSWLEEACLRAREAGGNRVVAVQPEATLSVRHGEAKQLDALKALLREDRFSLFAQRILDLKHDDQSSSNYYEILLRAFNKDKELIPAGEFIPVAEQHNMMPELDRWVVKKACQLLSKNRKSLHPNDLFAINLSTQSIRDANFFKDVFNLILNTEAPATHLCFDITETLAVEDLQEAITFINELQQLGCRFALDDSGKGLSYGYLKTLPVDYLKIDGSIVRDMDKDKVNYALVKAINEIAHILDKKTIAEFAESEEIIEHLREMGIDFAQGYGIAKPEPLEDALLKR